MPLNIEPIDRNQRTAFQEREALRNKVNEIIETIGPMEITWDAVPTTGHGVGYAVTSEGIKASVDNEATIRRAEDIGLQDAITEEQTARANQDTALGTRISGEETARANQDTALQTAIDTEQGTRASEDVSIRGDIASLGTRITTEETNRANQDTVLGTRIDGKQNTLTQGTGITIQNDVISATGITPTAGVGIRIADGVISQTNIHFQIGSTIGTTFFTNLRNNLVNITPFVLTIWSDTEPSPAYLSFIGSRFQQGKCFGSGTLMYTTGNIFYVYEIDGLDTTDDTIEVYCYNNSGTKTTLNLSKQSLGDGNFTGYFNVGTV